MLSAPRENKTHYGRARGWICRRRNFHAVQCARRRRHRCIYICAREGLCVIIISVYVEYLCRLRASEHNIFSGARHNLACESPYTNITERAAARRCWAPHNGPEWARSFFLRLHLARQVSTLDWKNAPIYTNTLLYENFIFYGNKSLSCLHSVKGQDACQCVACALEFVTDSAAWT